MTPADTTDIQTKGDLIAFLEKIQTDYSQSGHTWENQDLSSFFEAFHAWLDSSEHYYKNQCIPMETVTPWRQIADAFATARIYE